MLRHDLDAAEIPYRDGAGKVFDFHALRHQFISMLARSGVHPKTAQELARHSTITLTMDHYTHVGIRDLSAALTSVPGLPTTTTATMQATGTEGREPEHLQSNYNCNSDTPLFPCPPPCRKVEISCDPLRVIDTTDPPGGRQGGRTLQQRKNPCFAGVCERLRVAESD
jgi:hypothetical protein